MIRTVPCHKIMRNVSCRQNTALLTDNYMGVNQSYSRKYQFLSFKASTPSGQEVKRLSVRSICVKLYGVIKDTSIEVSLVSPRTPLEVSLVSPGRFKRLNSLVLLCPRYMLVWKVLALPFCSRAILIMYPRYTRKRIIHS